MAQHVHSNTLVATLNESWIVKSFCVNGLSNNDKYLPTLSLMGRNLGIWSHPLNVFGIPCARDKCDVVGSFSYKYPCLSHYFVKVFVSFVQFLIFGNLWVFDEVFGDDRIIIEGFEISIVLIECLHGVSRTFNVMYLVKESHNVLSAFRISSYVSFLNHNI